MVAIPTASFIMARRQGRGIELTLLIPMLCVSGLIPGIALHNLFLIPLSRFDFGVRILAFSWMPIQTLLLLRIGNKIRKMGEGPVNQMLRKAS
jgi:hypothetical protein